MRANEGSDLTSAEPGPNWRSLAFRFSLWALIAALYFFSPLLLVFLGWFQEPFSELGGAESVSHRVHEVLFGIMFAQAMVGAVSQLRDPIGRRAGMLQTVAALTGFVLALAAIGVVELLGLGFVALAVIATVLHPAGRAEWRRSWHPQRGLVVLALSGAVPFALMAVDNFAKATVQAADHLTHWGGVAAFAIVQILLALIASLRPPGYRLVAGSVGVAGLAYFAASLLFPFDASARPQIFAIWILLWSLSWIAVAVTGRSVGSWIPWLGGIAIVAIAAAGGPVGIAMGVFIGVVLLVFARREDGPPRFLSIGLAAVGYILLVGGGLVAGDGGEPPNIPHGLVDGYENATRQTCMECHAVGAEGATLIPHDSADTCGSDGEGCWDGRSDCLGCHHYDPALGGPTELVRSSGGSSATAPTGGLALSPQQLVVAQGLLDGDRGGDHG